MGNEVEARIECVRDHLQRPDHSDWQLTDARIRSTVYLTVPNNLSGLSEVVIFRSGVVLLRIRAVRLIVVVISVWGWLR